MGVQRAGMLFESKGVLVATEQGWGMVGGEAACPRPCIGQGIVDLTFTWAGALNVSQTPELSPDYTVISVDLWLFSAGEFFLRTQLFSGKPTEGEGL